MKAIAGVQDYLHHLNMTKCFLGFITFDIQINIKYILKVKSDDVSFLRRTLTWPVLCTDVKGKWKHGCTRSLFLIDARSIIMKGWPVLVWPPPHRLGWAGLWRLRRWAFLCTWDSWRTGRGGINKLAQRCHKTLVFHFFSNCKPSLNVGSKTSPQTLTY